jgi:hypothetical protein
MEALPYFSLWVDWFIRRILRIGYDVPIIGQLRGQPETPLGRRKALAAPIEPMMSRRVHAARLAKLPAASNRLRRSG